MNLGGRTALVTGASGGLGHAIARGLAARGAQLVLTGRRVDVLDRSPPRPAGAPSRATSATARRSSGWSADAGAIDVLVANAGLPVSAQIQNTSVEEIDRALDVNLRAPMVLARLLGERHGRARRRPHRVHLLAGRQGGHGRHVGLLRHEVRPARLRPGPARRTCASRGVGVSTVFPGFIRDAGMFAETGAKLPPYVGTKTARGRRRRPWSARSSTTAARSTSRRCRCASGRDDRERSRPRLPRPCSASSAADEIADAGRRRPARQALVALRHRGAAARVVAAASTGRRRVVVASSIARDGADRGQDLVGQRGPSDVGQRRGGDPHDRPRRGRPPRARCAAPTRTGVCTRRPRAAPARRSA